MKKIELNGWYRLWILASGIWATCIGFYLFDGYNAAAEERVAKYELSNPVHTSEPSKKEIRIVFSKSLPDDQIRKIAEEELIPKLMEGKFDNLPLEYRKPYEEFLANEKEETFVSFAKLGVLIPILLLIIGQAVAWVINGFRGSEKKT